MTKMKIRVTEPKDTNKYYLHYTNGGLNRCIKVKKNGSCLPNCVGYAYGRYMEATGAASCKLSVNDAKNWFPQAVEKGLPTGTTPKVGAIICWASNGCGHVAHVEKVYDDESILISQSGYNSGKWWTQRLYKPYSFGSGYRLQGFIYNPNVINEITPCKYDGEYPNVHVLPENDNAKKIVDAAVRISWPLGTAKSKWQYKTGKPTTACKAAMQNLGWTKKVQFSDCGYFVKTVINVAGLGDTNPLKWTDIPGFDKVHEGAIGSFALKAGDIIRYKKKNGHQHTFVVMGKGNTIAEAGRSTRFGVIRSPKSPKWNSSSIKKATIDVLRVKGNGRAYLMQGDTGEDVKLLQAWLNWALDCDIKMDGKWGSGTQKKVLAAQKILKVKQDGKVGGGTLAAMKGYKR